MKLLLLSALATLAALFAPTAARAQSGLPLWFQNDCPHPVRAYFQWTDPVRGGLSHGPWNRAANSPSQLMTYGTGASAGSVLHRQGKPVYLYAETTDGSNIVWKGAFNLGVKGVTYPMMSPPVGIVDGHYTVRITCSAAAAAAPAPAPAGSTTRINIRKDPSSGATPCEFAAIPQLTLYEDTPTANGEAVYLSKIGDDQNYAALGVGFGHYNQGWGGVFSVEMQVVHPLHQVSLIDYARLFSGKSNSLFDIPIQVSQDYAGGGRYFPSVTLGFEGTDPGRLAMVFAANPMLRVELLTKEGKVVTQSNIPVGPLNAVRPLLDAVNWRCR